MSKQREIINPDTLFQADGFTHAVATTGTKTIYLAGQLPWDKNFEVVGEGDLEAQTKQSYKNIEYILNEVGATWDHVVKLVTYTTMPEENMIIAKVREEVLNGVATPADTIIGISGLADPRCFIEIEAIVVM